MSNLTINDLTVSRDLNSSAMSAVSGGLSIRCFPPRRFPCPIPRPYPRFPLPRFPRPIPRPFPGPCPGPIYRAF